MKWYLKMCHLVEGVRWGHEIIKAKLNKLIKHQVKRVVVCDGNKGAEV